VSAGAFEGVGVTGVGAAGADDELDGAGVGAGELDEVVPVDFFLFIR
jgi:hypothetical protein